MIFTHGGMYCLLITIKHEWGISNINVNGTFNFMYRLQPKRVEKNVKPSEIDCIWGNDDKYETKNQICGKS